MTDIRTVENVTVDDHLVRVAEQETGDGYDAAVIAVEKHAFAKAIAQSMGNSSEYDKIRGAPIADHRKKYVAVGKAVEQFLESEDSDE